jgi:hypothetical protein
MKARASRKRQAGKAWAALSVCGLLGLVSPSLPAQEAVPTNAPPAPVATAYLDYQEVKYTFIEWPLGVTTRSSAFEQEPPLSRIKVIRGWLQLGGGGSNDMAFAWDRSAGKLYLDLNRNLNLTDDPAGVFSCQARSGDLYQTFASIHLPFRTPGGNRQALVDLVFNSYQVLTCRAAMRSLWLGKLTLQGEEWQVGRLANEFEPRLSLESGRLLLRPWAERNVPFNCQFFNDSLAAFPWPQQVFFGGRGYRLQGTNEVQGDSARAVLQFTEQRPKLGDLEVTGSFVHRVVLQDGTYLVIVDKPEGVVKVPVGKYRQPKLRLKRGEVEAGPEERGVADSRPVTVSDQTPLVLTGGGPLTNSVSIIKQGRNLVLNYELLGPRGRYQLANQDRSHPPEFTVYQGDKKVASGKFEFG